MVDPRTNEQRNTQRAWNYSASAPSFAASADGPAARSTNGLAACNRQRISPPPLSTPHVAIPVGNSSGRSLLSASLDHPARIRHEPRTGSYQVQDVPDVQSPPRRRSSGFSRSAMPISASLLQGELESDVEGEEGEVVQDDLLHHRVPLLNGGVAEHSSLLTFPHNNNKASHDTTCHQELLLEEEDLHLSIVGYHFHRYRVRVYYFLCVATGGILYLLGRWIPRLWVAWVGKACPLGQAQWVVAENSWGEVSTERVKRKYYGGSLGSVFGCADTEEAPAQTLQSPSKTANTLQHLHYFDYRYIRFVYHPLEKVFIMNSVWKDPNWCSIADCLSGITSECHAERVAVFGLNVIDIREKSIQRLLVDEVLHPFYIFQIFSMILWFVDDYVYYAVCIFLISSSSIVSTLFDTKRNMRKMREMSKFVCDVRVYRNKTWRFTSSDQLVPGDLIDISCPSLHTYPCDALLLGGDAIVNESMLTGECVPVSKLPANDKVLSALDLSGANVPAALAKHVLFAGTKSIRVRGSGSPASGEDGSLPDVSSVDTSGTRALAMVLRTGFNTTKGALVRSMMFPRPNKFQFYRDSFRFIGVLSVIAVLGFLASLYNFIRMGVGVRLIIVRALDLITIVVPPALPATMSIGTGFAISRLRKANIFCISPPRVNICGKLNAMCFDKTGTLTEEGLDVLGIRFADPGTHQLSPLVRKAAELPQDAPADDRPPLMLHAITTCHSLKHVNGELIGDPLDFKMFEFTGWVLEESSVNVASAASPTSLLQAPPLLPWATSPSGLTPPGRLPPSSVVVHPPQDPAASGPARVCVADVSLVDSPLELAIVRVYEFVSKLRRMAVVSRSTRAGGFEVFVKGAPEVMGDICLPESCAWPRQLASWLGIFGGQSKPRRSAVGIDACHNPSGTNRTVPSDYQETLLHYTHHGYRVIACAGKAIRNADWSAVHKMKRDDVESGLTFLGFVIFENKLKPGTAAAVSTLRTARIRQIMCTGDNILTAISVSRECGLILPYSQVYVPRFLEGSSDSSDSTIVWTPADGSGPELDPVTLMPAHPDDVPSFLLNSQNYDLAVSGEVFRFMVDYGAYETLNRMLVKAAIFARMSPDEKHELVEKLHDLGYVVGFCGDGANDCGALKAADVGISLSEAEASVAAPFTSRTTDVSCVISVIREGRAALVTSFSCFKYMALYSLIQFTTVSFLYMFDSNLGDFQFLYIDLFLIIPIAIFMGHTGPHERIYPKRPTASLVSKKVLSSLLGHVAVQAVFQSFVYRLVRQQPWYEPPVIDANEKNISCFENTTLFLVSCFQYVLVALIFSVGAPYRKKMTSNVPYIAITTALLLFTSYIVSFPDRWVRDALELKDIPFSWRTFILCTAAVYFACAWAGERVVFPRLAGAWSAVAEWRWLASKSEGPRVAARNRHKLYKQIEVEMGLR